MKLLRIVFVLLAAFTLSSEATPVAGRIGGDGDLTQWKEVAGLPVPRYGSASAVFNGSLYVIGGSDGSPRANVFKFDGTVWTEVASVPVPLWRPAAGVMNGALYVIGGWNGSSVQPNVYRFDGTRWAEVAGLPAARYGLAAGALSGSLYAAGGDDASYNPQPNVYRFDGTTWTEVAALPFSRSRLAAGALNGQLYIAGGFNGGPQANVYRFNETSWVAVANLPASRDVLAAGVRNGALYAVGGYSSGGVTTTNVFWYDETLNVWTESAGLPASRSGHTVAELNGSLFAIGGADSGAGYVTNVFQYPGSAGSSGVSPDGGSFTGGYEVVISGSNLGDGSDVTNVTLGGVTVSGITRQSATEIVVVAGAASAAGTGDVRVFSTSYGETVKLDGFTYLREGQAPLVFEPASPQVYGTTQALTVSGGSGAGAVSYAVLSGPGAIVDGTNLGVTGGTGEVLVSATKEQDDLYYAASVTSSVAAAKADQVISFSAISDQLTTSTPGLRAAASSGLDVSFAVGAGPAAISGGTSLSFSGTGLVSIVASQAGDGNFNAAPDVTNTFSAVMPALSVTPDNRVVGAASGGTTFEVSNAGSGAMTYTASESEWWLSIAGGSSGGNSGTITVAYTANLGAIRRVGTITVAGADASGSPRTVTVTQMGQGPDFVVEELSMSPPDPAMGKTFDVTAQVLNQGTQAGDAGYLSLWVDHPGQASVGERGEVGRYSVGTLAPGQSKQFLFSGVRAPALAGGYTLRAFADSAGRTPESVESNNQSARAYEAVEPYVDLEVVDVDVAPLWPLPGGRITTYVTVNNRGNVPSVSTRLRVWADKGDAADCGEGGGALYTVSSISPWSPRRETVTGLIAPAVAGDYTLRAFLDSSCVLAEASEANNQGTLPYTVYNPTPNLTVTSIALSPSRPRPGQVCVATVKVKNTGTGSGVAGRVGVWMDRLTAPGIGDAPDAYVDVTKSLAPGSSASVKVAGLIAPSVGARAAWALVDASDAAAELSEVDNTGTLPYTVQP